MRRPFPRPIHAVLAVFAVTVAVRAEVDVAALVRKARSDDKRARAEAIGRLLAESHGSKVAAIGADVVADLPTVPEGSVVPLLAGMGPPGIEGLRKVLNDDRHRDWAIVMLGECARGAAAAVPELRAELRGRHAIEAAVALTKIVPDIDARKHADILGVLSKGTAPDAPAADVAKALQAIGYCGAGARSLKGRVEQLARDKKRSRTIRLSAASVLLTLGSHEVAGDTLMSLIDHDDGAEAAAVLARLGARLEPRIEELERLAGRRAFVVGLIGSIGGAEALAALTRIAKQPDRRTSAMSNLVRLDPFRARRFWSDPVDRKEVAVALWDARIPAGLAPWVAGRFKRELGRRHAANSTLHSLVRTIPRWPRPLRADMKKWLLDVYDNVPNDARPFAATALAELDDSAAGTGPLVELLSASLAKLEDARPADPEFGMSEEEGPVAFLMEGVERLGGRARGALPLLEKVLRTDRASIWLRAQALRTSWAVAPDPAGIPRLLRLADETRDLDDFQRLFFHVEALHALAALEKAAHPARAWVHEIRFDSGVAHVACLASRVLMGMPKSEPHVADQLTSALVREQAEAVSDGIAQILLLGPRACSLAPWVRKGLSRPGIDLGSWRAAREWLQENG